MARSTAIEQVRTASASVRANGATERGEETAGSTIPLEILAIARMIARVAVTDYLTEAATIKSKQKEPR
jgi:hypothetical protein